jgi:vancomycin resistance protein YoaR
MIETITSLLKAHGEDTSSSYTQEEVTEAHLDLSATGDTTTSNASPEIETVEEDEEKGPDHYRWKNDSQLSIAKDKLEASIKQLEYAIQYRAENSHLMMRGGDKAGTGDLYKMKEQLEKLHDSWDEQTEYYGM